MKIQPYNKNSNSKKEERRTREGKIIETKHEKENEEENQEKKNTERKIVNKNKIINTVQFSGTNKAVYNEQLSKIENKSKNGKFDKTLRCNLTAQFKRGNSERGIVPQHPNRFRKYIDKVLKEISIYRRMSERIVTSTPRQVGIPVEGEEDCIDFLGFEKTTESYRDIEEEMSSIDTSFYERETVLQGDESYKEGEESGVFFNGEGRRKGKERRSKERENEIEEEETEKSKKKGKKRLPKMKPIKVVGAMAMKCTKKGKICKNLEKSGIIGKYLSEESWSEERKLEKVTEKMEKKLKIGKKGDKVKNIAESTSWSREEEEISEKGETRKVTKGKIDIELVELSDSDSYEDIGDEEEIFQSDEEEGEDEDWSKIDESKLPKENEDLDEAKHLIRGDYRDKKCSQCDEWGAGMQFMPVECNKCGKLVCKKCVEKLSVFMIETKDGKRRYASCYICVREIATTPSILNQVTKYIRITEEMIGKRKIAEINEERSERFKTYDLGGRPEILLNRYAGCMEEMDLILREVDDIAELNNWEASEGTNILMEWRKRLGDILGVEKNEIAAYLEEDFTDWSREELIKFIKRLVSGTEEREKQMANMVQTMEKMDEKFRWITLMKATVQEQKDEIIEIKRLAAELEDIIAEEKEENNKKDQEIERKDEHIAKTKKEIKNHMERQKELWDQIDKISQKKAEDKRIRGNLLADLTIKNNMVKEFAEERRIAQETKRELEKVKRELAEEKQKRGNEVTALEQENTSEIMAGEMKDQQIRSLQRAVEATRAELDRVRSSNEQNKEKLKAAETRKNMYKEEKEKIAKEKEVIEREVNKLKTEEREARREREQQIGYWQDREAGQIIRIVEHERNAEELMKKVRETREVADNFQEENIRLVGILNQRNAEAENIASRLQDLETSLGVCNDIVENMTIANNEMKKDIKDLEVRNADLLGKVDKAQKNLREYNEEADRMKEELKTEAEEKMGQLKYREDKLEEDVRKYEKIWADQTEVMNKKERLLNMMDMSLASKSTCLDKKKELANRAERSNEEKGKQLEEKEKELKAQEEELKKVREEMKKQQVEDKADKKKEEPREEAVEVQEETQRLEESMDMTITGEMEDSTAYNGDNEQEESRVEDTEETRVASESLLKLKQDVRDLERDKERNEREKDELVKRAMKIVEENNNLKIVNIQELGSNKQGAEGCTERNSRKRCREEEERQRDQQNRNREDRSYSRGRTGNRDERAGAGHRDDRSFSRGRTGGRNNYNFGGQDNINYYSRSSSYTRRSEEEFYRGEGGQSRFGQRMESPRKRWQEDRGNSNQSRWQIKENSGENSASNFDKQLTGEGDWWNGDNVNIENNNNNDNRGNVNNNNNNEENSGNNSGFSGNCRGNNNENNEDINANTNSGNIVVNREEGGEASNRKDREDSRTIQVGQRIERMENGKYIGQEKRKLEAGHPERLPRLLGYSANGRWLLVPQGSGFKGKYPKYSVPMRVEPYRETREEGDKEAKEACAYGSDARMAYCWYDLEEWRKHFKLYEEPKAEECTFMNGELFTNKVIVGRWGKDSEEEEGDEREEGERSEEFSQRTNSRGRGWSGYGRGQSRNYEEEDYYPRRRHNEDEGWIEGQRGRGSRSRGRGGRRGTRGYRGD